MDEAHGFGVLGEHGMGLAERENLQHRITFQMGTLSKAAGLSGGYLAASRDWIDLLTNRARSFIYSTAPPPALAHAAIASLALIRSAEGATLRAGLQENIALPRPAIHTRSSPGFWAATKPPSPPPRIWNKPASSSPPSATPPFPAAPPA